MPPSQFGSVRRRRRHGPACAQRVGDRAPGVQVQECQAGRAGVDGGLGSRPFTSPPGQRPLPEGEVLPATSKHAWAAQPQRRVQHHHVRGQIQSSRQGVIGAQVTVGDPPVCSQQCTLPTDPLLVRQRAQSDIPVVGVGVVGVELDSRDTWQLRPMCHRPSRPRHGPSGQGSTWCALLLSDHCLKDRQWDWNHRSPVIVIVGRACWVMSVRGSDAARWTGSRRATQSACAGVGGCAGKPMVTPSHRMALGWWRA